MGAKYRIERITDMMAVPQDKWDAMLADVKEWLELRSELAPLVDAGLVEVYPHVIWIDGGVAGISSLEIEVVDSLGEQDTPADGRS